MLFAIGENHAVDLFAHQLTFKQLKIEGSNSLIGDNQGFFAVDVAGDIRVTNFTGTNKDRV